jgi:hypothetical protein
MPNLGAFQLIAYGIQPLTEISFPMQQCHCHHGHTEIGGGT